MTGTPNRTPLSGGFPIAICAIVGSAIGLFTHEPSLGLVLGGGVGVAIAVAVWLVDRRR